MPNLIKTDSNKTETDQEIVDEVRCYYSNLYTERAVININLDKCLNFNNIPKLTFTQQNELEGQITKYEASKALSKMKNNKSPGSDGFTVEFF